MKKLLLITTTLISLSLTAQAKDMRFDTMSSFPKARDFYARFDGNKQPSFKFSETGIDLINAVNNRVNKDFTYIPEPVGKDYWQTPAETIKAQGGDCEDFAILKWKMLLDNGIPEKDMFFWNGFVKGANEMHLVLVVNYQGETFYLDNTTDNIHDKTISPMASSKTNRYDYWIFVDDAKFEENKKKSQHKK